MTKNSFYFICFTLLLVSCKQENPYHIISGETMGTYYKVSFSSELRSEDVKKQIDSLLIDINNSLSTYIDSSTISKINTSDSTFCFTDTKDQYFNPVFDKAKEVYSITGGVFDPTIAPIINYWGFGYKGHQPVTLVDSTMVDSLMQLVGFTKINQQNNDLNSCYSKLNKSIALDFSALAKGYGIDVLANYLDKIRIDNYLIDIGGESRAKGVNKNGNNWTLGISKPTLDSNVNEYIRVISLNNKSIATSGNYRNYRKVGEKIYSHIINPKKGYYQYSNTLSVSVIAEDCMTADALATSFMILSREESKQIANRLKNVDVFFIYLDENQDIAFDFTPGFNQYIIQ